MRKKDLLWMVLFLSGVGIRLVDSQTPPGGFEHFITRQGSRLYDGECEFRFISYNVSNLLCIEDNLAFRERNPWRLPDAFEIEDALQTVKILGGNVARTYVLTVHRDDDPVGTCRHVMAPGKFDEDAFQTMDLVLAKANQIGVRLIIPFVDNWRWMGGIGEYAAFRGEEPGAFWTDPQIRADFKATIEYFLNRRNTQTGVTYKDDKAILAWELGNELRDAPPEWIAEMAAFVKTIDNRHLLSDGLQCSYLREDVIADSNIDILATHHYEFNAEQTIRNIETSVLKIGNKKPYYIGEFGFFDLPGTEKIIDAVIAEKKVAGALLWSLRFHNRDGGFYWHSEPSGKSLFKAYHYPGFQSAAGYAEKQLMTLMRLKGWQIRAIKAPEISAPFAPKLLPIADVSQISWQGAVGAVDYIVERSDDQQSWYVVANSVSDADRPYEPLFNDTSASIGKAYYYRVFARNQAGTSPASNNVGPVQVTRLALIDHLADKTKIFQVKGFARLETGQSRSFKEDIHRLSVENGSEIIYRLSAPIRAVYLQDFILQEKDDVNIFVSADGVNYTPIKTSQIDYRIENNDYKYWRPILVCATEIPGKPGYLKLKYVQKTQIGKIEIYYGDRNY